LNNFSSTFINVNDTPKQQQNSVLTLLATLLPKLLTIER